MIMNTITRIVVLLVILSTLPQNNASAGFYDWLVSKEEPRTTLVSMPIEENTNSFGNLFTWSSRELKRKNLEEEPKIIIIKTHAVRATGYSSTPDQTDSTPFITASGTLVRDGIIAANFYVNGRRVPFGTLVRIPDIYGDKIFIVEDRMNARYTNNIDIWFPERSLAKTFGSKKVTIEIVEES